MILGAIPGATPDKWVQRWRDRYPDHTIEVQYDDDGQLERITAGTVDLGYIRFRDGEDPVDKDIFHRVLLYQEQPVVCAAAEHWIAAAEESVSAEDLAEETFLDPRDFGEGTELAYPERTALEVAASGSGVVVLASSVARMLGRKDVVIRRIEGAPHYETGLAWRRDHDQEELIQEFIGIARGRKAGSHRNQLQAKPEASPGGSSRRQRHPQPRSPRARPPRGRRRPR